MQPRSPPARSARGMAASSINFASMRGRSTRGRDQPLPNAQSRTVERDEERLREQIMLDFNMASNSLDSESFHFSNGQLRQNVVGMKNDISELRQDAKKAHDATIGMTSSVDGLSGQVQALGHTLGVLADVHTESVKSQMMELKVTNVTLERRCQDLLYELELERAQVSSLKNTLRGHIVRSRDQMEELRDMVREQISAEALDLQQLRKDLLYRADAAASAIATITGQKPLPPEKSFDARAKQLEEAIQEANRLANARFSHLRQQLNLIKVSPDCERAHSLHSNIPSVFRKALMQFSQEELITLFDTLSFEPGVVSAISTSVVAKHSAVQSPLRQQIIHDNNDNSINSAA